MSKLSRNKGHNFENSCVKILREEFGVDDLKRNLSQYQDADLGDIFLEPFLVECKRYKSGNWFAKDWWVQAKRAAAKAEAIPVLIWKYDRQPIRVTLPVYAVNSDWASDSDQFSWPTEGNAVMPLTCDLDVGLAIMREWLI
mgnify:CR=1 FL=1